MTNPGVEDLFDYPFRRLADLLADLTPPADRPVINLAIGEPQGAVPAAIRPILDDAFADWGRYPPVAGTPELRRAIADWLSRRYALPPAMVTPDHVMVTAGTREPLFLAGLLTVPRRTGPAGRPVVLMPNPLYHVYAGAALMAGAEPVAVAAGPETGFLPDYSALPEDLLSRTALAFLCSPANPQGAVADIQTLTALVELARSCDFVLAADECYSEYGVDAPAPGLAEACAALGGSFAHVMIFNSLSKRSAVPGLRCGFVAADPDLIARFTMLRAYGGTQVPLPIQAAATWLWGDEAHVRPQQDRLSANLTVAERHLGGHPGWRRPAGGMFVWLDVGDGPAVARHLWQRAGLRVMPGAFMARPEADGTNPGARHVRIALVHPPEVTEDAMARLAAHLPE